MISVTVTKLPCVCTEVNEEVICGDDCIAGKQISDSMIETEEVARSRGKSEIYDNYSHRMNMTGKIPLTDYIKAGSVYVYTDVEKGDYFTLVTRSAITINKTIAGEYTADLNIILEREA